MNEFKRILALIIAMIMVTAIPMISMAEEPLQDTMLTPMSLFPIEEVNAYIDLTEIPLEQLPKMTSYELLSYLRNKNTDELIDIDSTDKSVWANFFNDEEYLYDPWKILNPDEYINILDHYNEDNGGIQVIIGSGNQLDPGNVRYFVDFQLPTQSTSMDLSRYVCDELYNFSVSNIVSSLSNLKVRDMESVEILWYVEDLVNDGYDFGVENINGWIKLDHDDSVKFAPTLQEKCMYGRWGNNLKMIIKFDDTATLYTVNTKYPDYIDMFDISVYTQEKSGKRTMVETNENYGYEARTKVNGEYLYYYDMYTELKSYYSYDGEYYLGLNLTEDFAHYGIKVIKGWEHSEDKIHSWLTTGQIPQEYDITDEIIVPDMSKKNAGMKDYWLDSYGLEMLICISSLTDKYIIPVSISMYNSKNSVDVEGIFTEVDGERIPIYHYSYFDYEEEEKDGEWYCTEIITYHLKKGYNVNDKHSVSMIFYDNDNHTVDASKVDKAVVGHFYSFNEAKNMPDIKKQLFAEDIYDVDSGYKADFSGTGVDFTIFSGEDIWHFRIKTAESEYEEEPDSGEVPTPDDQPEVDEAPEIGSDDSYFKVNDLYSGDARLDTYTIPYQYDTYYSYGYQTLLVNDTEADMSAVSPEVVLGDNAKVYFGDTMENTNNNYYNKLSPRDFSSNSVRYTVSTQNHANQKNYWVTAVKKEEGAKLFVNGPDEREIFLNNYFGNVHDIFVANVGSEELTGITATIDATNIKLDKYWTVGGAGNDTLAPFTTTSNNTANYHGELFNVARIRLIPDGEGEIEGTLTITADGQEPKIITLSGTAGNPKVDTASLHDAVKYVPYSSIITTNNMHDWNKVTFSLSEGKLPDGLTLYPNGEIYGVPKEIGEFPITIKAKYSHNEFEPSYADFVLTVKDNSDDNIDASVDDGYEITTRLPETISAYSDMEFVIDGEFSEFVDLWLDGDKLTENIDYTARSGSTKITIKSKTFSNAGKGKHTISAEFRVGGDKNNKLKTAAQNFTIGDSPKVTLHGGGSSYIQFIVKFETNGGSAVDKQTVRRGKTLSEFSEPVKEGYVFAGWFTDKELTKPFDISESITSKLTLYAKWNEEVIPDARDFADVSADDWFFEDVQWAYANNIMVGYNSASFAPSDTITTNMVVTVLSRLAGVDITAYEDMKFEGVEAGQWYTPYANWAKEFGIADDLSFSSSTEITREMMGVVLLRFFEAMKKDFAVTEGFVEFADADLISDKAMNAVQTLYKLGIFKGKGNNMIDPCGNTTRAEFAALIHRVYTLLND